jgi:hypothetical protein
MKVVVSAASLIAGATAGALTYTTLSVATEATATSVYLTTSLTRLIVGKGVSLIAGPTTAAVVETAIGLAGHGVAVPAVRKGGLTAAALTAATAATVAAAVAGVTATFLTYLGGQIATSFKARMLLRQAPEPIPSADTYIDKEFSVIVVDYDQLRPINV